MTIGKTIALTIWTFVGKEFVLLFNTLSRFVIAFLPRSKCLLISWLQSQFTVILEPKRRKFVTVSTFSPSICHEVMGLSVVFQASFFTLLFHPHQEAISCLLSAIRVLSSAYLRLLIFLLTILIPTCDSSSWHFTRCTVHMN